MVELLSGIESNVGASVTVQCGASPNLNFRAVSRHGPDSPKDQFEKDPRPWIPDKRIRG